MADSIILRMEDPDYKIQPVSGPSYVQPDTGWRALEVQTVLIDYTNHVDCPFEFRFVQRRIGNALYMAVVGRRTAAFTGTAVGTSGTNQPMSLPADIWMPETNANYIFSPRDGYSLSSTPPNSGVLLNPYTTLGSRGNSTQVVITGSNHTNQPLFDTNIWYWSLQQFIGFTSTPFPTTLPGSPYTP